MYYVQFYNYNLKGEMIEKIASDGYRPIDGRFSIFNLITESKKKADQLKKVAHIVALQVRKGTLTSYNNLTKIISYDNRKV